MKNNSAYNGDDDQYHSMQMLQLQYATQLTKKIYRAQATLPFFGIGFFIAFLMNNFRYKVVNGTWLQTHFRWQVQTFIYGLVWAGLGVMLIIKSRFLPIEYEYSGFAVVAADVLWIYYRIIKGRIKLKRGQHMYKVRAGKDVFE